MYREGILGENGFRFLVDESRCRVNFSRCRVDCTKCRVDFTKCRVVRGVSRVMDRSKVEEQERGS